jgi:PTS system nitrogen regulatory IIA component
MPTKSEFRNRLADMPVQGEDDPFLARWLEPEKILCDVRASDMAGLFDLAAREIGRLHGLDPGPVFRALSRREQAEPTALGSGFAIPHARIAGIEEPLTLLIRLDSGIEFHAPDATPVDLFLFIMVPLGDQHAHLQLLAVMAQLFSDRRFRLDLDGASSAAAMAGVLKAGIDRIAR